MNSVEGTPEGQKTANTDCVEVGGGLIDLGKVEVHNMFGKLEVSGNEDEEDVPPLGGSDDEGMIPPPKVMVERKKEKRKRMLKISDKSFRKCMEETCIGECCNGREVVDLCAAEKEEEGKIDLKMRFQVADVKKPVLAVSAWPKKGTK